MVFKPLKKHNLYESIANQLLTLIREGQFKAGDQLPGERELAESLGVNRTTLREALRVLELMRVVEKRPGEGVFVRDLEKESSVETLVFRFLVEDGLDNETLRSAFEAMIFIEASMARLAAQRATPEEVDELQKLCAKIDDKIASGENFTDLDQEFHQLIGKLGKSPVLCAIDSTMWIIVKKYARLLHRPEERRKSCALGHRRIVEAIAKGDPGRAGRVMEEHLQGALKALFF